MKTNSRFSHMLFMSAIVVGLITSPIFGMQQGAFAEGAPITAQAAPASTKFDGPALYEAAFQALSQHHIMLADLQTRQRFAAEWQHKHDQDGMLSTPEGTDKAVAEMMHSLGQRFDYYMNEKQTQQEDEEITSALIGIGAQLKLKNLDTIAKTLPDNPTREQVEKATTVTKDDPLVVVLPIEGSPAEKAGLKKDDVITRVDGVSIYGMTQDAVIGRIRGKENTQVRITVERTDAQGKTSETTLTITRAKVTSHVTHFKNLGNGMSYVKLDNFMSQYSKREMLESYMKAATGKGLIIDLRGNPGGRLDYVLDMIERILPEGTMLVIDQRKDDGTIEDRTMVEEHYVLEDSPSETKPDERQISTANRPRLQIPADMPMVVIVDGNSYSASEIMSGILQHNHRALIVGQPTGGKGVGQSVIDLPFGRRMHVTSFRFRPGGEDMDWIGIVPDVEVTQSDPAQDNQLDAAMKQLQELIQKKEARDAERQGLKQKHEDEFKKHQANP